MFDPYDIEKDRGPDPNVVKHRLVAQRHLGRAGGPRPQARREHAGLGERPVRRLDRVHDLPGAQRPQPDAVLQRLLHQQPLEHGQAARRRSATTSAAPGGPTRSRTPTRAARATQFFDVTAYALPAPGTLGNAKKGSLKRAGHLGGELRLLQGRRRRADSFRLQLSALLDNAFNHPQFFPVYGSGFARRSTSYLIDGEVEQRHDGRAGGGRHRQRGRVLAREGLPHRLTGHVLATSRTAAWLRRPLAEPRRVALSLRRDEPRRPARRGSRTRRTSRSCSPGPRPRTWPSRARWPATCMVLGRGRQDGTLARPPRPARLRRRRACSGRVIAVSRFSRPGAGAPRSSRTAIEAVPCDLLDPDAGRAPARAPPTCSSWPAASSAPATAPTSPGPRTRSCPRWWRGASRRARIVVFSTGNVYAPVPRVVVGRDRSRRAGARRRIRAVAAWAASACSSTTRASAARRCLLFRLFYAVDLRYGTLVDVARAVFAGRAGGRRASAASTRSGRATRTRTRFRSLGLCASPPRPLVVTGPRPVGVREAAERFAARFRPAGALRGRGGAGRAAGRPVAVPCRCSARPRSPSTGSFDWTADWVARGGRSLGQADALRGAPMAASEAAHARVRAALRRGLVIPAHPLALTAARKLDERRQAALTRYYCAAGAGGVAVGVHTTQFAIRAPGVGLLEPVLAPGHGRPARRRGRGRAAARGGGGRRGPDRPGGAEAELGPRASATTLALLSLGALREASHAGAGRPLPPRGRGAAALRLLPAARGGRARARLRLLARVPGDRERWRRSRSRPFNRYQTLDVVRALAGERPRRTSRSTPATTTRSWPTCSPSSPRRTTARRCASRAACSASGRCGRGGRSACSRRRSAAARTGAGRARRCSRSGAQLTDANAALFDARNGFAGCIAGHPRGPAPPGAAGRPLVPGPAEDLSPGQMEEIDRVLAAYPHLTDDAFVAENLERWLA